MSIINLTTTVEIDGKTYHAEHGKISNTFIGYEDHGIFAWNIDFEFPGSGQGTGMRGMVNEVSIKYLANVIEIAGVRQWEHVRGRSLLVLRENKYGPILGILNAETEKYLIF